MNKNTEVTWIDGMGFSRSGKVAEEVSASDSMIPVETSDGNIIRIARNNLNVVETPKNKKLQEIFENIGHVKASLVLSPELDSLRHDPMLLTVYHLLDKAQELMKGI